MDSNSNLWIALATLTYAVLYLCLAALHTRHNRVHQYKNKDNIKMTCRRLKEGKKE